MKRPQELIIKFLGGDFMQEQNCSYIIMNCYFRFSTVWHNHLRNKHLTEHLRNNSNELATVRFSAFCGAMLSNNSFLMQR